MKFIKDLFLLPFRLISCIRLIPYMNGTITAMQEVENTLLKQVRSMNLAIQQIQKDQIKTHAKQFDMTHTAILKMAEGIAELQEALGGFNKDAPLSEIIGQQYYAAREDRSRIIERIETGITQQKHTDQKVSETLKAFKEKDANELLNLILQDQADMIELLREIRTTAIAGATDTRRIVSGIETAAREQLKPTAADVPAHQKKKGAADLDVGFDSPDGKTYSEADIPKEEWTGINSPNSDPSK